MKWKDAILVAIEELSELHPEWSAAFLALMMRAGQLTTEKDREE